MSRNVVSHVVKEADPVAPDGIRVAQHVDMVIRTADYLSQADLDRLQDKFASGVPSASPKTSQPTAEPMVDAASSISVVEEVKSAALVLKLLRSNLSKDVKTATPELIKTVQAVNASLGTINKLLPELGGANQLMKLQTALVEFGSSLPEEHRGEFLRKLRESLREDIPT